MYGIKPRRIRPADAVMLMRHVLSVTFPADAFAVNVAHLPNGLIAATLSWVDGPAPQDVQEIADRFTGAVIGDRGQVIPQVKLLHGDMVLFGLHVAYTRRRLTEPTGADAPAVVTALVAA